MPKRKLISHLESMQPVSKMLKNFLENDVTFRKQLLKKKASLLIPRMAVDEVHYLFKGSCKAFSINEDNNEEIFMFFMENSIVILPEEFFAEEKNTETHIVMLEDSELYTVTKTQMDDIYTQCPDASRLANAIRSNIKGFKENHRQILMKKEGFRYKLFCERFPELCYKLSDHDSCAFLGLSRSTLALSKTMSRIKDRTHRR